MLKGHHCFFFFGLDTQIINIQGYSMGQCFQSLLQENF